MKKVLCMCLALCLMLTTFVGCGKKEPSGEKEGNSKDNIENIHNDANKTDADKVDMSLVTHASPFKNGIAIVRYNYNNKLTDWKFLFIDKNGNILFETKDYYCDINAPITSNGMVILNSLEQGGGDVVCDIKNNKIYTASDLGGTSIVYDGFEEAFRDGYIFVEKVETTYDGSTKSLAIYNDKLEEISTFSEEIHTFTIGDGYQYKEYNNGYIFNNPVDHNIYLDVANGVIGEDVTKIPLNPDLNAWNKLEGKFDTLAYKTEFSNNCAGVVFESEGVYYYSITDIRGNLAFDPIQTEYSVGTLNGEKREYVLGCLNKQNNNFHIEMFDMNGRTGTIDIPVNYTGTVDDRYLCIYGDGTVVVEIRGKNTVNICYYNMDGTKLF